MTFDLHGAWRRSAVLAALALSGAAGTSASEAHRHVEATTGLFGLYPRHTVVVSLVDLGRENAPPLDTELQLVGADDRPVARAEGRVKPGAPLTLTVDRRDVAPGRDRLPVRAVARVTPGGEAPRKLILTVEVVNNRSLDFTIAERCPLPGSEDPPPRLVPIGDCGCVVRMGGE